MAATMLSIPCKTTDKFDYVKPLSKYIRSVFGDAMLAEHADELERLNQLREDIRLGTEKTEASRARLLSYLSLVISVDTHFPCGEENLRFYFYWYDCVSRKRFGQYGMILERLAVKFGCAAVDSQIGGLCNRATEDGIRQACAAYQRAAGVFESLRDDVQASATLVSGAPDLSPDYLFMASNLMLAQAQECFYEKATRNNMSHSITCKLAAGVGGLYETALGLMQLPALKNSIEPSWVDHVAIRSALYYALAYYHASHEYAEQRKYGIQVAYLGRAYNYLAPITPKQIKNVSPDVGALFSSKQQVIGRALQQAQTDNNRIYHESVPASVPEIERKVMVKATAHVDPVLVGSEDPFLRLIPVAVSQALQQYQERQMAVVRSELDNIEDHNNLVKSSLCSMNLPGALLALDNPTGIPPQVTQRIAHFTQVGGIQRVEELCMALEGLAKEDRAILDQAITLLDQEEEEDNQTRTSLAGQWTRTPSHTLTSNLRQEAAKFRMNIEHATKSDAFVRRKYEDHKPILARLAGGPSEVAALFPSVETPDRVDQEAVASLKALMAQLDALITQREELATRLKQLRDSDNITSQLMTAGGTSFETVFEQELAKYSPLRQEIQANLQRQTSLIGEISEANQLFVQSKSAGSQQSRRDQALSNITTALDAYNQLEGNLTEGIQFYTNFQELLQKFKQRCSDFVLARRTEKAELLTQLKAAASRPAGAVATMSPMTSTVPTMYGAPSASFMPTPDMGVPSPSAAVLQQQQVFQLQQQQLLQQHQQQQQLLQQQLQQQQQQQYYLPTPGAATAPPTFPATASIHHSGAGGMQPIPVAMLPNGQMVQLPPGYVLSPQAMQAPPGSFSFGAAPRK